MDGEEFAQQVTVGYIYMLKLSPWSTTKSTRGRSDRTRSYAAAARRQGAVRRPALGEMGSWALEAYGAAHILQDC